MSSGFSLLEEAWGSQAMPLPPRSKSSSSSSTKRRKRFASRLAPLCESTGKEGQTGFADSFQTSLAPFEPIYVNDDDARGVSKRKGRAKAAGPPPPPPPRAEHDYDEDSDCEPGESRGTSRPAPPPVVCPPCPPQKVITYAERPRPAADNRYDAFLYVFSGVLLLFLLEQFLQIGIHIGRASII